MKKIGFRYTSKYPGRWKKISRVNSNRDYGFSIFAEIDPSELPDTNFIAFYPSVIIEIIREFEIDQNRKIYLG